MKKLTDQELDSVFKNAAEGYQPAFDQAAWEAMNARLDEPKPAFWKRWMTFASVGLLIFSAGIWVGIYVSKKVSTKEVAESPIMGLVHENNITIPQAAPPNQSKEQAVFRDETNADDRNNTITQKKINVESNRQKDIQIVNADQKKEITNVIIFSESVQPADETTFLLQQGKLSPANDNQLLSHLNDSIQGPVEERKLDSARSDVKALTKEKEMKKNHVFYLRLLVSPDFTSINYASANDIGSNYAVLLDYQLSHRWSVSTGAILSEKTYSSDEEFTYGAYTADRMKGDCRVLDIPINVNYYFRPQSKTSFYAGLGLSSYIMLEEDYTYTFDTPSGSRDFSSYFERKNNEWFKMLNVSLGVQYRFAPWFQLQVEPFLKAPLAGVGEWDVKLSSVGIFMGLKYKIN